MERITSEICDALKTYKNQDHLLVFTQSVPDAETRVSIKLKPVDKKYRVSVYNNRTDSVFNSTPITEVFADKLPKLQGMVLIPIAEMAKVLMDLVKAEKYFGVWINVTTEAGAIVKYID